MKDVGATRGARIILGSLYANLSNPIVKIIRMWGYVTILLVAYLHFFFNAFGSTHFNIIMWMGGYLIYLAILEFIRWRYRKYYDHKVLKIVRIFFQIFIISWLMAICTESRYILFVLFITPIFATNSYFRNSKPVNISVWFFITIGLIVSNNLQVKGNILTNLQIFSMLIILFGLSLSQRSLNTKSLNNSGYLTKLTEALNEISDLKILTKKIIDICIEISDANHVYLIICDMKHKHFYHHDGVGTTINYSLLAELLKNCSISHLEDVSSLELLFKDVIFNPQNQRPGSVVIQFIHNSKKEIIGLLWLSHTSTNFFDPISTNLIKQFCYWIGNNIENCIIQRKSQITLAKDNKPIAKISQATNEDQVISLLLDEITKELPNASGCVIHKFCPPSEELHAIASKRSGELRLWDARQIDTSGFGKSVMEIGVGIAGKSLEIREPILVGDVEKHPWFIKSSNDNYIKSLLVSPIIDPTNHECIGTVSLNSELENAFTTEDEIKLFSLTHHASEAIANLREFDRWREHGGNLKNIYNIIRSIDIEAKQNEIYQAITDSAVKVLGFQLARLRIRDKSTDNFVTVATSGIPEEDAKNLMFRDIPLEVIEPFLTKEFEVAGSFIIPNENKDWRKVAKKYFYFPDQTINKSIGWRAFNAFLTPLYTQSGRMIGLLSFDVPKSGNLPNPSEIEHVDVFSRGASWTIELSQARKQLEEHQSQTRSFIRSIYDELAKSKDFQTICELAVYAGTKLLNAEGCSLYIVKGNSIELTHSTYLSNSPYIGKRKIISSSKKCGLTSWVASTGQGVCFGNFDYQQHSAWAGETKHLAYLDSMKCQSLLIEPIKSVSKGVVGVLTLENKLAMGDIVSFSDLDIEEAQHLTREIALAFEVIEGFERIKDWEAKGIEDDLHELKNLYRWGVVANIESIKYYLEKRNFAKVDELMNTLGHHSQTTLNEIFTIHAGITSKYLEFDNVKDSLCAITDNLIIRLHRDYDESLPIFINCPDDLILPAKIRYVLLRVAAGAIINAISHSGILSNPRVRIDIGVWLLNKKLTFSISDNGIGSTRLVPGYGINRMKSLIKQLQDESIESNFSIISEEDKGTSVVFDAILE